MLVGLIILGLLAIGYYLNNSLDEVKDRNKLKILEISVITLAILIVIGGLILSGYSVYLYYTDFDSYVELMDFWRPIRWRGGDHINPLFGIGLAIIVIILEKWFPKDNSGILK